MSEQEQSSSVTPQPIGSLLPLDTEGFIVKDVDISLIQEKWKPVVQKAVEVFKDKFKQSLHSIYIRGSVAKGKAQDTISDLDTIVLVNVPRKQSDLSWFEEFNKQLQQTYPFIKDVEIMIVPVNELDKNTSAKIFITTQSICIFGEDISESLPKLKPGKETIQHVFTLAKEIENTKNKLQENTGEEFVSKTCTWIMRRILRAGCELVMERSQSYTRDLYPCYELFSKYYPEQEAQMYRVLELALNPTRKAGEVVIVLQNFGPWFIQEIKKFLKPHP